MFSKFSLGKEPREKSNFRFHFMPTKYTFQCLVLLNDLPGTGYPCYAEMYGEKLLGGDQCFFTVVLSIMDPGNVDTSKV